jgi:hypothetical protein
MDVKFLFWNTNKRKLNDATAHIVSEKSVDLLFLAEYEDDPGDLLMQLNATQTIFHYIPGIANNKIHLFSKFGPGFIRISHEERGLIIWELILPNILHWILCGIHSRSKLHSSSQEQFQDSIIYSQSIRRAENQLGHDSTVVFGDFNQNPFEQGFVNVQGYNAVMSRTIAEKPGRRFRNDCYPFFYNPSWSRFGDLTPGPPGSYYYSKGSVDEIFWNLFDQIIMRPSMIPKFRQSAMEYITGTRQIAISKKNGAPNSKHFSDHFPLYFEFNY